MANLRLQGSCSIAKDDPVCPMTNTRFTSLKQSDHVQWSLARPFLTGREGEYRRLHGTREWGLADGLSKRRDPGEFHPGLFSTPLD